MRWLPFFVYLGLAATTAATALVVAGADAGARARIVSAEGSFELTNSADGAPIFSAAGIGPGESASGTVVVGATGTEPADLSLSRYDLADTPGPGGGPLSRSLWLRVTEVTAGPDTVYSGPLATMPTQRLGRIEPGASRSFEFVATLPEDGPAGDQNDVQGAATSVAYIWTASEVADETPPAGEGPPASGGPPTAEPPTADLYLKVSRVKRRIRHGRLLVWAGCDLPCRIVARGRVRARGPGGRRAAKLRLARPPRLAAGPRKLWIRVPRGFRDYLARTPGSERLRAKLTFVARDATGELATAKRTLRPKLPPTPRRGRSPAPR